MDSQQPSEFVQYLPVLILLFAAIGFAVSVLGLSLLMGKFAKRTKAKDGAYECGKDPIGEGGARFSVKFHLVAMLFILFDVEAVFMLPWAVIFKQLPRLTGSRMFGFWEMLVYLGFVAVGLFYVWKKGILNWANDKGDL